MVKAYMREDLQGQELILPSDPQLTQEEFEYLEFEIIEQHDEEFDHPDGYNMKIRHPITQQEVLVYSYDFDFKD